MAANSLPESAFAIVNHRLATHDSIQDVKHYYHRLLGAWAGKYKLNLRLFGDSIITFDAALGSVTLTSEYDLEPSPVASEIDPRFQWLTGTLKKVFGDEIIVAPTLLAGNTDTRYYWELCSQIYRMSPWTQAHDPRGTRMHTVDERMPVEGLMEMVKFYHQFILDVDSHRL